MKHEWKLRFLPVALIGLLAVGCDSGTDPEDVLADFDGQEISTGLESSLSSVNASSDATALLYDFYDVVLGGGSAADRHAALDRIQDTQIRPVTRMLTVRAQAPIPAELLGETFVWDPDQHTWVADETRTGAPANGVRMIWYATDGFGPIVPLQERGYIDLTDQSTASMDQLGTTIVRTAGGTVTLADFIQSYASSETETGFTEELAIEGYFSDGTDRVDFEVGLSDQGNFSTGNESYSWTLFFDAPAATYSWELVGSFNGTSQTYNDEITITLVRSGATTIVALDFVGTASNPGTGTLSHKGMTLANITMSSTGGFSFTKPGGGSFTSAQAADLETLVGTMFIYGPLLMFSMPFLLL